MTDPSVIMRLALAYRSSMVLFAATELKVFTALGGGGKSAEEVARACGASAGPVRFLLDACAAEGLLERDAGRYRNAPAADAYLVEGKPAFIGHGLKFSEDLYPVWARLAELMRTGRPAIEPHSILGDDKAKTRAFVFAMHERARGIGAVLPHGVDLAGRRRLLDVGGGPGTYSIALVQSTPGLRATVLDLPGVLEITREIVDASGCGDRIDLLCGDYLTARFGHGFDVVLLSGMMHRETADTCRLLLQKAHAALDRGGMVIVSDVFFEDDRKDQPPFATYFAMTMMLTSAHGAAHAKTEMARWMAAAGFDPVEVRPLPPPNPHTLLLGTRP